MRRRRHGPRIFDLSAALAVALAATCAVLPASAHADPATFQHLEATLSDALAGYDRATVDRLWDDDLTFVFPTGEVSHKAARLKAQVPPVDTVGPKLMARNDAVDVTYEDKTMAVVLVHSSWRFGDAPPTLVVATHIWIRRAQGWRLISAQVAQLKAP
jgi:hypothetical protein